jgi:hypothetical protein
LSGFDFQRRHSRRDLRDAPREFQASAGLVGPAARRPRLRTVGWACSVQGFGTGARPSVVAQRESTRLITWLSRVRFPSTTRRSRLRSHCSETLTPSQPGPKGSGQPDGRPSPELERPQGRKGLARATRTGALKHVDSGILRRRRGTQTGRTPWAFELEASAAGKRPATPAGPAQAVLRAFTRDRRSLRSLRASCFRSIVSSVYRRESAMRVAGSDSPGGREV